MANQSHVSAVRGDFAAWRRDNPQVVLDLSGADLKAVKLPGAYLHEANLHVADLRGADFTGAVLRNANLTGADLRGAILDRADLTGAVLERAALSGASAFETIREAIVPAGALAPPSSEPGTSPFDRWLYKLIVILAISALVIIVGFAMLLPVDNMSYSRGLITIVFTVGAIAIAIILFAARWMTRADDATQRFQDSREVLTILIGLLGTIIGWYFGQDDRSEASAAKPAVVGMEFTPSTGVGGATVVVRSEVAGGKLPLDYEIRFGDQVRTGLTRTNVIVESFSLPEHDTDTEVPVRMSVTDAAKQEASFQPARGQGPVAKTKPPSPSGT
jgi:pentapeptide repeat protein